MSKLYVLQSNFEVFLFLFQYVNPPPPPNPPPPTAPLPRFDPRGIIWTNLVEVHLEMLHTKYQCPRPLQFWRVSFFAPMFQLVNPPPPARQGQFRHQFNNLDRDSLGDVAHQISKLFLFQRRRILKFLGFFFFFFVSMFQFVTPGVGPILTPGASYEQIW